MTEETTAASTRTTASLPERGLAADGQSTGGPGADTAPADGLAGQAARGTAERPRAGLDGHDPEGTEQNGAQDQVTVRLPAEGAYLSVLRTATAGLAARLDFTLDEIEDLRIAVDEACAMLVRQAVPGSSLECGFTLGNDMMTIAVSVPCREPQQPASDTFAWTVLTALAGSVDAHVGPGDVLTIVLRKKRESSGPV